MSKIIASITIISLFGITIYWVCSTNTQTEQVEGYVINKYISGNSYGTQYDTYYIDIGVDRQRINFKRKTSTADIDDTVILDKVTTYKDERPINIVYKNIRLRTEKAEREIGNHDKQ